MGTHLPIITLNINGLNDPTKRQWLTAWTQKQDPYLEEIQFHRHIQTEIEGWKKVLHANGDQKKANVTIFVSNKIDFKIMTVIRDKERHCIITKGSIQE